MTKDTCNRNFLAMQNCKHIHVRQMQRHGPAAPEHFASLTQSTDDNKDHLMKLSAVGA